MRRKMFLVTLAIVASASAIDCGGEDSSANGAGAGGSGAASCDGGGCGAIGATQAAAQTTEDIAKMCADLASQGCPAAECALWANNIYLESIDAGCGPKVEAYYECGRSHPPTCVNGQAEIAADCLALANEVSICMPSCGGTLSGDGETCNFYCSGSIAYNATCQPNQSGGKTCTCESGPAAGRVYEYEGPFCTSAAIDHLAWTNCGFSH